MTMPASVSGDMSLGHTGFSPSPIIPTTATVLVMNMPPHVMGDMIGPHVLGTSVHPGSIIQTSTKVFFCKQGGGTINGQGEDRKSVV